jgi:glycosyltransferase involved in cell wall biosynthesis
MNIETTTPIHVACVMMVKNESARLRVTLDSVASSIQSMIIYDTGSEDDTLDILRQWSSETSIPLYLLQGSFVDFSTSRNQLLDFADTLTDPDVYLLMDCNDELRHGESIPSIVSNSPNVTAWFVKQHWFSGVDTQYYNVRLLRARTPWRYQGVVHEYLQWNGSTPKSTIPRADPLVLFQDRTLDDDKSQRRFKRDVQLLLAAYEQDPSEPRTVFYLAQSYSCCGQLLEAYTYYKKRLVLKGFEEERFHSLTRLGDIVSIVYATRDQWKQIIHSSYSALFESFTPELALMWYLKAVEHTVRVEPLLGIVSYYRQKKQWYLAYQFVRMACELPYPDQASLFVDANAYAYTRYHLMGIIGYYANQFEDGRQACVKAIEARNLDIDQKNLQWYETTPQSRPT